MNKQCSHNKCTSFSKADIRSFGMNLLLLNVGDCASISPPYLNKLLTGKSISGGRSSSAFVSPVSAADLLTVFAPTSALLDAAIASSVFHDSDSLTGDVKLTVTPDDAFSMALNPFSNHIVPANDLQAEHEEATCLESQSTAKSLTPTIAHPEAAEGCTCSLSSSAIIAPSQMNVSTYALLAEQPKDFLSGFE